MARKNLEELGNQCRYTFVGEFVRYGTKRGWKGKPLTTVLLKDIRLKDFPDLILADHLWFNETKGFYQLDLNEGTLVQFDGRVGEYLRGYFGRREDVYIPSSWDYKIERPTKIKILKS